MYTHAQRNPNCNPSPPRINKLSGSQIPCARRSPCTSRCWPRGNQTLKFRIWWPLPLLQGTPHFGENFRGLVLGCMGTYDSESRRIFSHFSRSTRFSFLCTAPHSNICQFFVYIFAIFSTKFHHFLRISNQFHVFSSRFWWKFVGISRNWKMLHKISAKSQILTN